MRGVPKQTTALFLRTSQHIENGADVMMLDHMMFEYVPPRAARYTIPGFMNAPDWSDRRYKVQVTDLHDYTAPTYDTGDAPSLEDREYSIVNTSSHNINGFGATFQDAAQSELMVLSEKGAVVVYADPLMQVIELTYQMRAPGAPSDAVTCVSVSVSEWFPAGAYHATPGTLQFMLRTYHGRTLLYFTNSIWLGSYGLLKHMMMRTRDLVAVNSIYSTEQWVRVLSALILDIKSHGARVLPEILLYFMWARKVCSHCTKCGQKFADKHWHQSWLQRLKDWAFTQDQAIFGLCRKELRMSDNIVRRIAAALHVPLCLRPVPYTGVLPSARTISISHRLVPQMPALVAI